MSRLPSPPGWLLAVVLAGVLLGTVVVGVQAGGPRPPGGDVRVLYPAALTSLMEDWVRPSFQAAAPFRFLGQGGGSLASAGLVKQRLQAPDVFISSDPVADRALQGPANGSVVSWWVAFAGSQLVLAWNPASPYAGAFAEVNEQVRTVESALALPGLRICRADPDLDPQGYQTVLALQLDEVRSGQQGLAATILGSPGNPRQIFDPATLTTRVQSGSCDASFLYEAQALGAALPFVTLPASINLGDPAQAAAYAAASYTAANGQRLAGAPITFTITIPATTSNAAGAVAFVRYLLGAAGRQVLAQQGLPPQLPVAGGDTSLVPAAIADAMASPGTATAGAGNAPG